MLLHEGTERTPSIDSRLAALFSGIAGALNAAGFQDFGFFSANMTGNASAFSDHIGLGGFVLAGTFAALVAAFILGAFGAGLVIEVGRRKGVRGIYAYAILLEASLLACIPAFQLAMPDLQFTALLCLCMVMGIQNAATTRISDARVRTTHVSGMATDIGLGLASKLLGQNAPRFQLSVLTMTAFLLGGVLGGIAYALISGMFFLISSAILVIIGGAEIFRSRRIRGTDMRSGSQ